MSACWHAGNRPLYAMGLPLYSGYKQVVLTSPLRMVEPAFEVGWCGHGMTMASTTRRNPNSTRWVITLMPHACICKA